MDTRHHYKKKHYSRTGNSSGGQHNQYAQDGTSKLTGPANLEFNEKNSTDGTELKPGVSYKLHSESNPSGGETHGLESEHTQ